jgi:hypothetical protein
LHNHYYQTSPSLIFYLHCLVLPCAQLSVTQLCTNDMKYFQPQHTIEVLSFTPGHFIPCQKCTTGTRWTGGWVGPSYYYCYYLVCQAIGTDATPSLFCQPRMIVKMILEKQVECRLAGETEVLRENLPQRHFCPSQNPT